MDSAHRALSRRLDDEYVLAALFAHLLGGHDVARRTTQPAGARHLIEALRRLPEGGALVDQIAHSSGPPRGEDLARLVALMSPRAAWRPSPDILHHTALLRERAAAALRQAGQRDAADEQTVEALVVWAQLRSESDYLGDLAQTVAGAETGAKMLAPLLDRVCFGALDEVGRRAQQGIVERTPAAARALRLLARVPEIAARAETSPDPDAASSSTLRRRAARWRRTALDNAEDAIAERLDEANAGPTGSEKHFEALREAVELWRFADEPERTEVFIVSRTVPVGWDLYQARRWRDLRKLCELVRAPVDRFTRRKGKSQDGIERLAYAASAAQLLVFRAELGVRFESRMANAELALELCDTHRNARLIMADLLVERAQASLDKATIFHRERAISTARADLDRATALWPSNKRIAALNKRIARMGGATGTDG